MSDHDLPLFQWQPIPKVIPFPGNKLIGKARHVARLFIAKSEKAQQHYWQATANRYVDGLINAGVSKAEAEKSLDDFRDAVRHAIDIINHQERNSK